jgi:Protein of unknown function (DUF2505)
MRFQVEHRFHGPPGAVAAVLADPGFYEDLVLPDVSQPVVLDHRTNGHLASLRFRYVFEGDLDGRARRLLGSSRLAWIQEVEVDSASNSGKLSFQAEADPKRLHGSADFDLIADGAGTLRRMSGELVVSVPVVGKWAERKIQPGLLRRLDLEAAALDERLGNS